MRAKAISISRLQEGEKLTSQHIAQWIFEAFEIAGDIPQYAFEGDDTVNNAFWTHLRNEISIRVYPMNTQDDHKQMVDVAEAIRELFKKSEITAENFNYWLHICRLLKDFQEKCMNNALVFSIANIGVTLVKELLDFRKSEVIVQSIVFCLQCFATLNEALPKQHKDIPDALSRFYDHCLNKYFELIDGKTIFLESEFLEYTTTILENYTQCPLSSHIKNYLTIVSGFLDSSKHREMFEYCKRKLPNEFLVNLLTGMGYITKDQKLQTFAVLKRLVKYSQEENLHFECDWPEVFSCTLYSRSADIREASLALFVLEAKRTGNNEMANQYTLLEKAIHAYRENLNKPNINDFIEAFEKYEDFVKCEKLFHLLRENVDFPDTCTVIISIIKAAADRLAAEPSHHEEFVSLVEELFRHIGFIEPYPHLLYRFINIVDLSKIENTFGEQIQQAKQSALNAFLQADQYGTAFELLEIIKDVGLDFEIIDGMLRSLLTEKSEKRKRETLILFYAADDVFGVLKKLNDVDWDRMFKYFDTFRHKGDPELSAISAGLLVNMLNVNNVSNISTGLLHHTSDDELIRNTNPAEYMLTYITRRTLYVKKPSFTSMMLGIAFLELHSKFTLPMNIDFLNEVFHAIAVVSCGVNNFNSGAERNEGRAIDLSLIKKFWRSVIKFYDVYPNTEANPKALMEYYTYADVNLLPIVEECMLKFLRCGVGDWQYNLFTYLMRSNVKYCKPVENVQKLIDKLFTLIGNQQNEFDESKIALLLFDRNLELLKDSDRVRTIWKVQRNLYEKHLKDYRGRALLILNRKIDKSTGTERDNLNSFRTFLQPPVGTVRTKNGGVENRRRSHSSEEDSSEVPQKRVRFESDVGEDTLPNVNESILN